MVYCIIELLTAVLNVSHFAKQQKSSVLSKQRDASLCHRDKSLQYHQLSLCIGMWSWQLLCTVCTMTSNAFFYVVLGQSIIPSNLVVPNKGGNAGEFSFNALPWSYTTFFWVRCGRRGHQHSDQIYQQYIPLYCVQTCWLLYFLPVLWKDNYKWNF